MLGNAAEVLPELVRRAERGDMRPDAVTDQTAAHDLVNGYLPVGWSVDEWGVARHNGRGEREPADAPAGPVPSPRSCWQVATSGRDAGGAV